MTSYYKEQLLPIALTILTFIILCVMLYFSILGLNLLPSQEKIQLVIHPQDILVGLTIYLKTSIDFAIFIGNLMLSNPGWRKRVAIEIGTAGGNALGTIVILIVWNFFREVPILMAIMIFIASLVLLKMAEESLAELNHEPKSIPRLLQTQLNTLQKLLQIPNRTFSPLLKLISPNASLTKMKSLPWVKLLIFSASSFGGTVALGVLVSLTLLISMFTNIILLPAILLSIHKKSMKKEIIEEPLIDIEDSLE